ncbi:MAG: adenosine deaminase family protein [Treponema sp.]|jgi:adenosine deaminase|nr:adenosine deaminase family protein [Treponema sp.]
MTQFTDDFIREIPKTDLHVHLDGSLRLSTLISLARERHIALPSFTEEGLRELVFTPSYKNLDEYLRGFAWTGKVLQDAEALEQAAGELAQDNAAEGVRYLEVRFAPQLHMHEDFTFEQVIRAVDRGLRRARDRINASLTEREPPFEYGIILCAMRFFNAQFSRYYRGFSAVHPYSTPREIIQMAGQELAKAAVKLRRESDIQLVAFDLAGSEQGYPASAHEEAYRYVTKNFMRKTVHAGEAYGPESIFQAITDLHADRIGHGLHLFDADMISHIPAQGKEAYVENLVNYIAENRITIEVCLTSNLQTAPYISGIRAHSFRNMLEKKLSLSLCTDNRLVSRTTICNEYRLALDNFAISPAKLKDLVTYGFKRSFYYHSYTEKRAYVRKVLNYYESLEKKHGLC